MNRERRTVVVFRRAGDRDRQTLLSTVRHELRTPLTSIRGYIETVLDGEELDPATRRQFLERARRQALRLGRMIEGMLEFSLLDLAAGTPESACDVAEQVRAAIDAVLPLARERGITIRAEICDPAVARVDGDACLHALLNVVENAIKHGRAGGRVDIACDRDDAFVRASVDDDGPGIAPAERDAIFALGVRGSGAAPRGSGIGLAVVRAIIRRAGGDVRVERSRLGGARFVLRFPEAFRTPPS